MQPNARSAGAIRWRVTSNLEDGTADQVVTISLVEDDDSCGGHGGWPRWSQAITRGWCNQNEEGIS